MDTGVPFTREECERRIRRQEYGGEYDDRIHIPQTFAQFLSRDDLVQSSILPPFLRDVSGADSSHDTPRPHRPSRLPAPRHTAGQPPRAIFFEPGDQDVYRDLLVEQAEKARVEIWAYCLMPNHVHLVAVPQDAHGLGRAIGEAHRRYTNFINARGRWTGHLFQSRFASVPMDEPHLIACVR